MAAVNVDKTEIVAQLQKQINGQWRNYENPYSNKTTNTTTGLSKKRSVSSGTYRVKFTFNAYIGNRVVETRYYTSSEKVM